MVSVAIRLLIASSILGSVLVNGLPTGAPLAACTTIRPAHGRSTATGPVPFTVDLSGIPNSRYVPGQRYNVILRGTSSNPNFRGFLIQGRKQADESAVGSFGSGTGYQSRCAGDSAATHTSRSEKTSVSLAWTAPPAGTGCLCFRYAFVDTYTMYWANQITSCISESLQTTIQASSGGTISGDDFTISLNANGAGVFECSLDGGSFQSCSSGDVFPNLSVGSHTMNVRFIPTGSCESFALTPAITFTISQPPPVLSVSVTSTGNKLTVNYDISDKTATCTCQFNSGMAVTCNSGYMFNDVAPGDHTITVACSTNSATTSRSVDISVMESQEFTIAARQQITGNDVQVFFNSTLPATFRCRLDSNPAVSCVSGHTFNDVGVGRHRIQITAQLRSNRRIKRSIRLPRFNIRPVSPTPPPRPSVSASAQVYSNCSASLIFSSANVPTTFRCRVNQGPWKTCSSGFLVSDLPPGTNNVEIEASVVGSPEIKSVVMAPLEIRGSACSLLEIDCPVCNPSVIANNYTFTFKANKPNVEYSCSLNNQRATQCNQGTMSYSNLRRRNQLFTVTATSCNGETATKNMTFFPKYNRRFCQVYKCGDVVTSGSTTTATFLSDDPDATFVCRLDGGRRIRSCNSPLEFNDLSSGQHMLDISPTCNINARGKRLQLRFSVP